MLIDFGKKFKNLPEKIKYLVYIMWLQDVSSKILSIFMAFYVFKTSNSVESLIIFYMIFMTWTLVWFSWIWAIFAQKWLDIKNGYIVSYSLMVLWLLALLLFWWTTLVNYIFWVIYGIWFWCFWFSMHGQELAIINDEEREMYTSYIWFFNNTFSLISLAIITGLFWASEISTQFIINVYNILFIVLIIIYLTSIYISKKTTSFISKKVRKKDISHFFDKKYIWWHIYYIFSGADFMAISICFFLCNLFFLKNEANTGLFLVTMTILSSFIIMFLSKKRTTENRLKYAIIFWWGLWLLFLSLALNFSLYYYGIFYIIYMVIQPIWWTINHTYVLKTMDNIWLEDSDFMPSMLLREAVLWVWRILYWLIAYFTFTNIIWESLENQARIAVLWVSLVLILMIWTIYMWEKKEKIK